jgi:hypothetical protein
MNISKATSVKLRELSDHHMIAKWTMHHDEAKGTILLGAHAFSGYRGQPKDEAIGAPGFPEEKTLKADARKALGSLEKELKKIGVKIRFARGNIILPMDVTIHQKKYSVQLHGIQPNDVGTVMRILRNHGF